MRRRSPDLRSLAERHGNGLIDVTSRANLQIRGVSDNSHRLLLDGLAELALLDPDADTESRRNILVTPFWRTGDETQSLAAELEEALAVVQARAADQVRLRHR